MQIKINNIEATLTKLRKDFNRLRPTELLKKAIVINAELAAATPVDTGRAMQGWTVREEGTTAVITNEVPYIQDLNNGHSKQAPSFYVESILLQHGVPNGALVKTSP